MKLPEVVFVKHCPNLSPERKVFLEEHLKERVPIKDVRWIRIITTIIHLLNGSMPNIIFHMDPSLQVTSRRHVSC